MFFSETTSHSLNSSCHISMIIGCYDTTNTKMTSHVTQEIIENWINGGFQS